MRTVTRVVPPTLFIYTPLTGRDSSGARRGFAHVEFEATEDASAALNALKNEHTILGQEVHLDFAPTKPKNAHPPSSKLYFAQYDGTLQEMQAVLRNHSGVLDVVMRTSRTVLAIVSMISSPSAHSKKSEWYRSIQKRRRSHGREGGSRQYQDS